jgi:molybdopterin-guanine dinucleotide biosynthesis protein A
MGRDKALILIEGLPLLQVVYRVAEACADKVYIVTPWQERYEHLLLPKSQFIREVPLSAETDGEVLTNSPIVGFAQALAHVETEWVLLLACDMPKLQVEVLQDWKASLDAVEDDAIAALAYHAKGWEPLCGFYRRRCLPILMEYINQGGRSFQGWLKQHSVKELPLVDPEMLLNCNTPEDLPSL